MSLLTQLLMRSILTPAARMQKEGIPVDTRECVRRKYRFPVKHLLADGDNSLTIVLQPSGAEAARRAAAYPYFVPVMLAPGQLGHSNFVRKPACDFG